jgi:cobalt-zinc-cadmium resistance protein CzcA
MAWGGQFENQQRAAARLASGGADRRWADLPDAVLDLRLGAPGPAGAVNIPFALVGGIVALWATGEYLSVPASVGFIALLGIAVLNGVVLVSYFNQLHAEGLPLLDSVTQGASAACGRC